MFTDECVYGRHIHNCANIPDDTDILITHLPLYGILDFDDGINYDSEELLARIYTLKIKSHLFGYIHTQHGVEVIDGTIFSNRAIMNSNYDDLSAPQIITI